MKTQKVFLLFAAFIFAAVAIYNIHLAQSNQNSDVSLADITVMAQANGESGNDAFYCRCGFTGGYTSDCILVNAPSLEDALTAMGILCSPHGATCVGFEYGCPW